MLLTIYYMTNEALLLVATFYTLISSWSRDGIQIFTIDLVFQFVDWSTLDLPFPLKLLMGFYSEKK